MEKVQGGDPTAGLASMNPFVCFCGGFTERNGHKKCHERKIWAWWRSWSGLSFISVFVLYLGRPFVLVLLLIVFDGLRGQRRDFKRVGHTR